MENLSSSDFNESEEEYDIKDLPNKDEIKEVIKSEHRFYYDSGYDSVSENESDDSEEKEWKTKYFFRMRKEIIKKQKADGYKKICYKFRKYKERFNKK